MDAILGYKIDIITSGVTNRRQKYIISAADELYTVGVGAQITTSTASVILFQSAPFPSWAFGGSGGKSTMVSVVMLADLI